ncbi:MAG: response regulator [Deltaproteobacteria bacterium]|nr:response regulator [Deltaproteobacteria bacterium]
MPPDKAQSPPSPSATVLVVDDNKDMVEILTRLLSRHGLNALYAYNGRDCLEIVRSRPVDVIVLDVMMPGMNGLEVCEELKQLPASPPIILLTAKDDMATRAAGMALGVSEFVVKPINNRDLLARIRTQISTRQWEREIDRTSATMGTSDKTPSVEG